MGELFITVLLLVAAIYFVVFEIPIFLQAMCAAAANTWVLTFHEQTLFSGLFYRVTIVKCFWFGNIKFYGIY